MREEGIYLPVPKSRRAVPSSYLLSISSFAFIYHLSFLRFYIFPDRSPLSSLLLTQLIPHLIPGGRVCRLLYLHFPSHPILFLSFAHSAARLSPRQPV